MIPSSTTPIVVRSAHRPEMHRRTPFRLTRRPRPSDPGSLVRLETATNECVTHPMLLACNDYEPCPTTENSSPCRALIASTSVSTEASNSTGDAVRSRA